MAVRTDLIRDIPISDRRQTVDAWLYHCAEDVKGSPLSVSLNRSPNWVRGVDSHGLNAISVDRGNWIRMFTPPFRSYDGSIEDSLPEDIVRNHIQAHKQESRKIPGHHNYHHLCSAIFAFRKNQETHCDHTETKYVETHKSQHCIGKSRIEVCLKQIDSNLTGNPN